jgi:sulfate adenylyltransferase
VSGTQLRQWLAEGADVPPEFSRPEVLAILREYYAAQDVARKPAGTSATQRAR